MAYRNSINEVLKKEVVKEIQNGNRAIVTEIQKFSLHDGPGIRTVVFFKGCPLRCKWCQNPETYDLYPECIYLTSECIGCMACVSACENKAISIVDGILVTDREKCDSCGACTTVCAPKARQIVGNIVTVEEIVNKVKRDKVFFDNSGGGVTLSGGEVTIYAKFASRLLRRFKEIGISTAVETCAYTSWEDLKAILEYTDVLLFDIKHTEPSKHKEYTGVDNKLILDNLKKAAECGIQIIPRYPLIPDVNDDEQTIREVCKICFDNNIGTLHILPFHQAGETKWEGLDLEYSFKGKQGAGVEASNKAGAICKSLGLTVSVGGSGI